MIAMRYLPGTEYLTLKAATRALLRTGTAVAAAAVTRVGDSRLSDYGHPHKPNDFAPIDVIADLEAECGVPVVTAALARLADHALVPLAQAHDRVALSAALARLGREVGDVLAQAASAAGDAPHAAGLAVLENELTELIEATVAARAVVQAKLKDTP
jgi:hypothetical protein